MGHPLFRGARTNINRHVKYTRLKLNERGSRDGHLWLEGEGGIVELQAFQCLPQTLVLICIHREEPAEHLKH